VPLEKRGWQPTKSGSSDLYLAKKVLAVRAGRVCTFIGGTGADVPAGLGVDATGSAVIAGLALSSGLVRVNAYQPSYRGSFEFFVVRLSPDGKNAVYSTFLGGPDFDQPRALAVTPDGVAAVVGRAGPGFPIVNSLPASMLGDAVIATLSPAVSCCSPQSSAERARGRCGLLRPGRQSVCGRRPRDGIPVYQAYQPNEPATNNAGFIAKFMGTTVAGPTLTVVGISPTLARVGDTVNITLTSSAPLAGNPVLDRWRPARHAIHQRWHDVGFPAAPERAGGVAESADRGHGCRSIRQTTCRPTVNGLTTDFLAPTISASSVAPSLARVGTTVTASFTASEATGVRLP